MRIAFVWVALFLPVCCARRFRDIASDPTRSGLYYRRAPSKTRAQFLEILAASLTKPIPFEEEAKIPWGTHGQPGVAVGDFNADGYDDIYVTNGPGSANSLFINQYPETGRLVFRDIARAAGVTATKQDSNGVCYGDLNGDGHLDLVVVSEFDTNKIFLSNGDKTFRELSWRRATGSNASFPSVGCGLGDVNNDGKLDLVIANGVPKNTYEACIVVPFELSDPNQLFINLGESDTSELSFEDVSLSSGLNEFPGSIPPGKFTLTWAAAMIDMNMDGNLDIVVAEDQCGFPITAVDPVNGVDRGVIRIQYGDGTGKFTSRPLLSVNDRANNRFGGIGAWMALGFGDLNCDGRMDIYASNVGEYHFSKFSATDGVDPPVKIIGPLSSRWWLADDTPQGYTDASIKETEITVFGWGNAVWDYDNDGDLDIVMVGSLDEPAFGGSDNPNVILKNRGCRAQFRYDLKSLEPTGTLRNYQGLAIGDFNKDGYPDVVAASGYRSRPELLSRIVNFSHPLDATAYFTDFLKITPGGLVWTGAVLEEGDMMVQINSETRPRCWAIVQPVGMQGILSNGLFNRGGLGATIIMKPRRRRPVMVPIVSGDSFGSQNSPSRNFGLGKRCRGTVDIVWPQGIRNRLYNVKNKDRVIFPEIPCSFTGSYKREYFFRKCVYRAVRDLIRGKVVSLSFGYRLGRSMIRARRDYLNNVKLP